MSARASFFPALFVLLWSTGFIAAKFGLPYAPPFTFLLWRFLLVAALMALVCLASRAPWPTRSVEYRDLAIAALLVHAIYLGGVFYAISQGMAAGTAAVLVGLQPVLTVFLARLVLHERVEARQWVGLALGIVGVWLVVQHKVSLDVAPSALVAIFAALLGISTGTLWQKRRVSHVDLRSGAAVQFVVCAAVFAPLALIFESPGSTQWTPAFLFALGWSVLVLSVGAISVLYWLLRHGQASEVASLFYLVPPVTAIIAFLVFGERLDGTALVGMAVVVFAVWLCRPRAAAATEAA